MERPGWRRLEAELVAAGQGVGEQVRIKERDAVKGGEMVRESGVRESGRRRETYSRMI